MSNSRTELQVNRQRIGDTRLRNGDAGALADGQVRVEVERFALTANNITYAQFGDMLAYWDFYPVAGDDRPSWGHVPCMGWGRVVESNVAGVDVGTRYYGWWPMATSIDITATPTADGFRDDGTHRAAHAPTYRSFTRTDRDPMYTTPADEPRHSLLRGLFVTGFLIDAFFAGRDQFGAEQSLVLSASSKTAIGFADCAHRRGATRVIGLTSVSNADFVRGLGVYDEVITYDDLDRVASAPSVIIDMAGAGAVVADLHRRLGDLIGHSMVVGKSHHDAPPAAVEAGPAPAMFFAPTEVGERMQEWGADAYRARISEGLGRFIEASHDWLNISEHLGPEAAQAAWRAAYDGTVRPDDGVIVSLLDR